MSRSWPFKSPQILLPNQLSAKMSVVCTIQYMSKRISRDLIRQVMAEMGSRGGKRSLETMTAQERSVRAKKASIAAAKKRTAERLARERAAKMSSKRTDEK